MFNKRILLLSHHNEVPGIGQKLETYLNQHFKKVVFLSHPLLPESANRSFIRSKNKTITYKVIPRLQFLIEGIIAYINLKKHFRSDVDFDLAICLDPLSFVQVYIYKFFGKVKRIIYFNVDYSSTRSPNVALNFIYTTINRFAYIHCDYFLYLTKKFPDDLDPKKKWQYKSYLVTHFITLRKRSTVKKLPHSIVFSGNITYGVDFRELFRALMQIKKERIEFRLDIYGEGDKKKSIQELVRKSSIANNVRFMGIIDNNKLIQETLPKYRISIAPYILRKNYQTSSPSHLYAGENLSTKIVDYIGAGLPVVSTKPYRQFDVIEKNKFGYLVDNQHDWYSAFKSLLTDSNKLTQYSKNALKYARNYDAEKVLTPIFQKIL